MNNEPVAWMEYIQGEEWEVWFVEPTDLPKGHTYKPLYTHPVKEQDDYCKAYWGNDNKFVDVFLPNSETEVIRFWNNTHPVKELTDEEIIAEAQGVKYSELSIAVNDFYILFAKAILKKAQEK